MIAGRQLPGRFGLPLTPRIRVALPDARLRVAVLKGDQMRRNVLWVAIAVVGFGLHADVDAKAKAKPKPGHKLSGSVELQVRSNTNISVAPASGERFDFADLSEFGDDDDDADLDDDEDDDEDDPFDDLEDVDPSEDEIEEDDAFDEDGDGVDDLLDPDDGGAVDSERRFTAKLGIAHKYTFADGTTSWNNGVKFSSDTHNQRDELDKFNWAATTGFTFAPEGSRHSFKPSLSYVVLDKDDRKFASTFVVSLAYGFEVSKKLSLGATYNYQDKDISSPSAPDARVDTLSLTADFKASSDDIFKFKYAPKVEDSTQVTRNTDAWGWEVTYTRKLPWDMTVGVGYKFDSVDHKNLTPNRKDDNRSYAIEFSKSFNKKLSLDLGYEVRDRNSNIPGKDAENDSFYLSGTWKF